MANLTLAEAAVIDGMCEGSKRNVIGTRVKALEDGVDVITADVAALDAAINSIDAVLVSAVAGDLLFQMTPATDTATAAEQNVGVLQVSDAAFVGTITAGGAGDIDVTVTADGMPNSPKTVTVAVANSDTAALIAGKVRSALIADADIGHAVTGFFTVTGGTNHVILTAHTEAANDLTVDISAVTDTAVFEVGIPLSVSTTISTAGVAPYRRTVLVELVNTAGDRHIWYTGTVPVTIADNAAGAASVTGGLNPTMTNGAMTISVVCQGVWAAANTNTLTVAQATILGATVLAKTSVETTT